MDYDPSDEKKAIDDAKAGVKGLVDSGIVEIPRIFIRPPHELSEELNMCKSTLQVPVVDLSGIHVEDGRKKIVEEIREASEKWGFFQVINHGVPSSVLEGMIDGTRKFHEQDVEVKKEYYSSDPTARRVRYVSNLHLYKTKGKTANSKDSLHISWQDSGHNEPEEIPPVCSFGLGLLWRYSLKIEMDERKAGIKGLVDSGIVAEELNMCKSTLQIPVVDLSGIEVEDGRKKIVDEIREASEKWGFFQVINHGIPSSVLEEIIDGTRKFHEQDVEVKNEYYSSDPTARRVRYESNLHLYKTKNSKDSLHISWQDSGHNEPEEIPPVCRKPSVEYINHVIKLQHILLGLLSEALGLNPNHLKAIGCDKGPTLVCNYYSACPQPEPTLGKHTDPVFATILLQDQNGGLQVMCDNQWADVTPIEYGLVVNIGDLLQIVSNDKFVSAIHRVVVKNVGPRISVACFFNGHFVAPKMYGPIKELISEENPPLYKEFQVVDYITKFFSKPLDKTVIFFTLGVHFNQLKYEEQMHLTMGWKQSYETASAHFLRDERTIGELMLFKWGLVDSGIVEIPRIFIRPPHELAEELNTCKSTLQVPVVDLSGIQVEDERKKIVDEIREASEKWGFFQLINHGIPSSVLEGMIDGTRKFHEQDVEVKKEYYSSDRPEKLDMIVIFMCTKQKERQHPGRIHYTYLG
ncbi:hypothetical protein H5410_048550 [Solanum commersonii]|uniref:Fe2OG dioxygenase domain-containing protein n=1 Tax=Solanum commersonii TaxID=4109 RepID=A0A9J5XLE6_SOLCO|nr:hypothetical protein H5410_048550 [Solanum commersonii]